MGVVRDFIPDGEAVEVKNPFVDFIPEQKVEVVKEVVDTKESKFEIKEEVKDEKKTKFQEIKDVITGAVTFKEVKE